MILAVRENEAGTSKNLTHQVKLDAVEFGTERPRLPTFHEIGNVDIGSFEKTLAR